MPTPELLLVCLLTLRLFDLVHVLGTFASFCRIRENLANSGFRQISTYPIKVSVKTSVNSDSIRRYEGLKLLKRRRVNGHENT